MPFPGIVRQTLVREAGLQLTVSTVRLEARRYNTVVFDDSEEKTDNGRQLGRFIVDKTNHYDTAREAAMDTHREALDAIRATVRKPKDEEK